MLRVARVAPKAGIEPRLAKSDTSTAGGGRKKERGEKKILLSQKHCTSIYVADIAEGSLDDYMIQLCSVKYVALQILK